MDDNIKRSDRCIYCQEDLDGYVSPLEKNNHVCITRRFGIQELTVEFDRKVYHCAINYCPVCGRKLNEREK